MSRVLFATILLALLPIPALPATEQVSLSSMIRVVQNALRETQEQLQAEQMLPLSEVILELNVVNQIEAEGRVGFWVAVFGGGRQEQTTSKVLMTFSPPAADAASDVSAQGILMNTIRDAIFEGAAARSDAITGNPPLMATQFEIAVQFALINSGDGSIKIAFPPFNLTAGGEVSSSEIQTITLKFND